MVQSSGSMFYLLLEREQFLLFFSVKCKVLFVCVYGTAYYGVYIMRSLISLIQVSRWLHFPNK